MRVRIGIVGDFQRDNPTHRATDRAFAHASAALGIEIRATWIDTRLLAEGVSPLAACHALLIAPGSPYFNMHGALAAIRYAREQRLPMLGTCGGFQHIVIEFARTIVGIVDAEHQESSPSAPHLAITQLQCSLRGLSRTVRLEPGSLAAECYGAERVQEQFYCCFGLNSEYEPALEHGGLRITGRDDDHEARVVELPGHPFFVGTLFVPQASSTDGRPHPLLMRLLAVTVARN
jgi:CTP synthase (UTP-ammonia lyase)